MARTGVPAFSIGQGGEFVNKPPNKTESTYHQPSDEFHEDWDFTGVENIARFGFLIGTTVANQEQLPTWLPGDEFLAVREKSGVK